MNDTLTAHPAVQAARRAVELLLGLGPESYRADIREREGRNLFVSPLAGQNIVTELVTGMCVGPADKSGNHHVTLALTCLGRQVDAYCLVTINDGRVGLIEAFVYVNGKYVIHRNVSGERDGTLEPWGMPDHFSVNRPNEDSISCPQCGAIVTLVVQDGRYFVNVPDSSVVDTELVYGISPLHLVKLVQVVHLADGLHKVEHKQHHSPR